MKTGGLGDVSSALPEALRQIGVDVRMLLPGYPAVLAAHPRAAEVARFKVFDQDVRLLEGELASGVPLLILDAPQLYDRGGGPYQADDGDDWEDNALRFGVLSRVAATLGCEDSPLAWRPDVVHCNDWPTALAPLYLRFSPARHAASIITIHNMAFQGVFDPSRLDGLELPGESLGMGGLEFYGRMSFLKGGLVYADAISTVSPTYAEEIQGEALGFGLDGVLRERSHVLHGVLNGIDTALWNPQTDAFIPSRYGSLTLEKKRPNKLAFRQRMGLKGASEQPLLVMVSRLTHQKGIDLLVRAAEGLLAMNAQIAVVGTGDRELIEQLRTLQLRNPEQVAVSFAFDEELAHLAEAGGDMFLMPSRYEPCGMNQMYSQRYGTPPIGNATGGLVDTIVDETMGFGDARATGFLMGAATSDALVETAHRAISAFHDAKRWRTLQWNGMSRDFGWAASALRYRDLYTGVRSLEPGSDHLRQVV